MKNLNLEQWLFTASPQTEVTDISSQKRKSILENLYQLSCCFIFTGRSNMRSVVYKGRRFVYVSMNMSSLAVKPVSVIRKRFL